MIENRASKRFRAIALTLSGVMILFAWVHSCFPADLSSRESEGVMKLVYRVFAVFGAGEALTDSFIRKAAHFSEYFAIGGLLMSCAYGFDSLRPQRFGVRVLFAGMLTALIDETIQLFSEGRAGMIADVWIDMGGVVCGAALMLGFYTLLRRRRAKKKRKTDFEG